MAMINAQVITETPGGTHNLNYGEYFYDATANIIYVGVGTVGTDPGILPSGVIDIIANGTYDVARYAIARVNVPGGQPQPEHGIFAAITVEAEVAITT